MLPAPLAKFSVRHKDNGAEFQLVPVLHVRVFDLAVMVTVVSWHHSIAAGGCSCESKREALIIQRFKHVLVFVNIA